MNEQNKIKIPRLFLKIVLLFLFINFFCFFISFLPYGKISLYNSVLPGRERLPFGENQEQSYNLTMNNIDAMIASHVISKDNKLPNEIRLLVIGDSSIWGFLQKPEETLTAILTEKTEFICKNKNIKIFNLGYPSQSVLKDLLLIDAVKSNNPDLILWFITLESLIGYEQLSTPLVKNNPVLLNKIISDYELGYTPARASIWDHTLIKQRRNFADVIRLQLYGVLWAATGIDQEYPQTFNPAQRDFEYDETYKNFSGKTLNENDLALDLIKKAIDKNSELDFIVFNEPILISDGKNSNIRYNYYYPRWAYDQYREIINKYTSENRIKYFDFWNLIPENNFTNSAIHLDSHGEEIFSKHILEILEDYCES